MSAARQRKRVYRTRVEPPKGRSVSGPSPAPTPGPSPDSPLSIAKAAFGGRALWVSLGLIAATAAVYAPVRHYDFVNYDDPAYIIQNPHVLGGLTWHGVSWAFTAGYASNWHPLTWLSHMLDVQLFGLSPGPYHLVNLLLHIANSILLFGLLHRMTEGMAGALGRSAFVATLFAIHPLHVESVAWVAERKDVLSTLFWMLTLLAYLWYLRQPRPGRYLVMLLLFALGLMAKPMLVTLPFVLLLLDYWPLGRVKFAADSPDRSASVPAMEHSSVGPRSAEQRGTIVSLVREKLPLFALAIVSSVVTFVVQRREGATVGLDALPLSLRAANALMSYFAYIGKMLWPTRLAVFYPYPRSIPGWWAITAFLGLIGLSVLMIRAGRRYPYLPVGWLWYLGTLVPVIGLVQVGIQSMADRYTYVPLIGLFIIVAWGVPDLVAGWPSRRVALPAAAALVIFACMFIARRQVQYWENTITLWSHTLDVTTGNYVAANNMGNALEGQGKISEASAQFSDAVRLKPDFAEAHFNLGIALASQGKVDEAIARYSEALRLKPDYAEAHNNLGVALASQGKIGEAITQYSEAVRLKPDDAAAHYNFGIALSSEGKVGEAIAQYSEVVRLKPDYPEAHNNLGVALAGQGKLSEAVAQYTEAVRLKPDYPEARNNLGIALARQGKLGEAH